MKSPAEQRLVAANNAIIRARPTAGPVVGLALSILFAIVMTTIATADQWLVGEADFALDQPSPITVRVPHFRGLRSPDGQVLVGGGSIIVPRGDVVGVGEAEVIAAIYAAKRNRLTTWGANMGAFFLMALLYASYLRRSSRGRLLRMQLVSMALTVGLAAAVKTILMVTTASVFLVPIAVAAVVAAVAIDLYGGLATALIVGVSTALVAPFDAGVVAVLGTQGVATVLCVGDGRRKDMMVGAGIVGGMAAAVAYTVFYYLSKQDVPLHELGTPLRSPWLAAFVGGAISGALAIVVLPIYQWLLGEITRNRLVELADLSNPLLQQISAKSPGTWQHSLAMANMAEVAANTIGANSRLVRVGAYYHDLGKSLQPKYFIENLAAGEVSPHDSLPPEVSCDAIFAHVTEGVRLARKEGLPERVIDFMHMHHGDGQLAYFWNKCLEQGNPQNLAERDFRYPGIKPQTRETAILAICDAVEAASRTLKQPDARSIENLVQRIVYGKLHLGQLDESGLSMSDLRTLSASLIETIKHAHHVRVEYPWQREEREEQEREGAQEQLTAAASPRGQEVAAQREVPSAMRSATQRILNEPPLDSLDLPRAYWRAGLRRNGDLATAATERVSTKDAVASVTPTIPERPDTEPEVLPHEDDVKASGAAATVSRAESPYPRAESASTESTTHDDDPVDTEAGSSNGHAVSDVAAPEAVENEAGTHPYERPRERAGSETLPGHLAEFAGPPPASTPAPDSPRATRAPRATIDLMDSDTPAPEGTVDPGAPTQEQASAIPRVETHRALSEDGSIEPGVMVVGPPPKTQPRPSAKDED